MTITQFVNTFRIVSFECPQFCYLRKRKVYTYIACVPGVDGKIHPKGVVQHILFHFTLWA